MAHFLGKKNNSFKKYQMNLRFSPNCQKYANLFTPRRWLDSNRGTLVSEAKTCTNNTTTTVQVVY